MRLSSCLTGVVIGFGGAAAAGQTVPAFFSGGAAAFEPEIGIVQSGVVQDVQAVVSPDRKYVTLNMQVQNTNLLALREFTFQTAGAAAPAGVVGIPPAVTPPRSPRSGGGTSNTTGGGASNGASASPSEIRRRADAYVLERHGVFKVGDAP